MTREAPAIVILAERVLAEIETIVGSFARRHKYSVGAELRDAARLTARAAYRAWHNQANRLECIRRLIYAVDDLKLELQIAKRVQAFKSFAQFESLARLISNLGQQCGGWQKEQQRKSQNQRAVAPVERAQILSAHDTSQEVNP